jgi:hypothetical protein
MPPAAKERGSGGTRAQTGTKPRDSGGRLCILRLDRLTFNGRFLLLFPLRRIPKVGQVEGRKLHFRRQGAVLLMLQAVQQRGDNVIIRIHKMNKL